MCITNSEKEKTLTQKLDEAKDLFDKAMDKAKEAVKIAREELTRPLTNEDIKEIEGIETGECDY